MDFRANLAFFNWDRLTRYTFYGIDVNRRVCAYSVKQQV